MVFIREYYVYKKGKKYGPYYKEVHTERKGGKVVQVYHRYVPREGVKVKEPKKAITDREFVQAVNKSIDRNAKQRGPMKGVATIKDVRKDVKKDTGLSDEEFDRRLKKGHFEQKYELHWSHKGVSKEEREKGVEVDAPLSGVRKKTTFTHIEKRKKMEKRPGKTKRVYKSQGTFRKDFAKAYRDEVKQEDEKIVQVIDVYKRMKKKHPGLSREEFDEGFRKQWAEEKGKDIGVITGPSFAGVEKEGTYFPSEGWVWELSWEKEYRKAQKEQGEKGKTTKKEEWVKGSMRSQGIDERGLWTQGEVVGGTDKAYIVRFREPGGKEGEYYYEWIPKKTVDEEGFVWNEISAQKGFMVPVRLEKTEEKLTKEDIRYSPETQKWELKKKREG